MEDFDLLYMLKTPFYLGDYDKALQEADQVEINAEDHRNQNIKNLYIVRSLTAKGDFPNLKTFMTALLKDPSKQIEVANYSVLA
jgi:flagellar assembly factor FliW